MTHFTSLLLWLAASPLLAGAPAPEHDVHVISVYESRTDHSFRHHPTGEVRVRVEATARPVVLVLSSYEPQTWSIDAAPGAKIERVVINGYHSASVEGTDAPVEVHTYEDTGEWVSSTCAMGLDEAPRGGCALIDAYADGHVASFVSRYTATEFTVP